MDKTGFQGIRVAAVSFATLIASATVSLAGEPANKVSAAGSTTEVVGPSEEVTLLSEVVKTSAPTDLILAVTLECSIVTDVTTVGNDDQSAAARVIVWVEIDGNPVVVSSDDEGAGRVVFCNRVYRRQTEMFDDEDATIRTFFSTRSTHGFNWLALNAGSATHTIEVKATLETEATSGANAEAIVGNRTLVVDPVMASNDETVQPPPPTPTPSGSLIPLP